LIFIDGGSFTVIDEAEPPLTSIWFCWYLCLCNVAG